MKPPIPNEPANRDDAPTADETAPSKTTSDEDAPLYCDPFAGVGPCRLALAIPEEQRASVTQNCPRCGPNRNPWRDPLAAPQDATCLLEGLELDLMALEDSETLPGRPRIGKRGR